MPDLSIDIELPESIKEQLAAIQCQDLRLPPVGSAGVQLPTGANIKGIADVTKGIPDDCSLTFSLMAQLPPLLANLDCIVKILGIIEPLISIVKGLGPPPDPIKLGEAIPKFLEAAEKLLPCVGLAIPGVPWAYFIRDIICLLIKILTCIVQQLESIAALMGGIALELTSAQQAGNAELMASLQCAQENANQSAQHAMASVEPVIVILSLIEPFLGLAQIDPIEIPTFGSPEDAESMMESIDQLKAFVDTLTLVADGLGGCN